jgi:hypothetical protein
MLSWVEVAIAYQHVVVAAVDTLEGRSCPVEVDVVGNPLEVLAVVPYQAVVVGSSVEDIVVLVVVLGTVFAAAAAAAAVEACSCCCSVASFLDEFVAVVPFVVDREVVGACCCLVAALEVPCVVVGLEDAFRACRRLDASCEVDCSHAS